MGLKKPRSGADLRPIAEREYARDEAGLGVQLDDPDPALRRWAARDLASHPGAGRRLCARLLVESDPSVREALFTSAAQVGGHAVVDGILPLLRSEQPALRNGAIELLGGLPDVVAPRIQALLQDADSDVRIFTINLLGNLSHPGVPQWLVQVLAREDEINVIGAALEVLAEVGGPETLEPLRAVRARFGDNPFITFAADVAIERIGSA